MPQLRLIDTTWGDVQTLAPSALGTEHEPMCEVVLPVPGVIAIAWRLGVLNNPAGLAINLLGHFRHQMGCGRGRVNDDRVVAVGTAGNGDQFPLQSLRSFWVTGLTPGAELATVFVSVMSAPIVPPGLAWLDAEEWTKPADAQRPYKIMANRYDGRPVYPGEQVWSDD